MSVIFTISKVPPLLFVSTHEKKVYAHHEMPLGLLHVVVDGDEAEVTAIDPCCGAPGCNGTQVGRGLYREFRVPARGDLELKPHRVEIRVAKRKTGRSQCAELGHEASLAGLIGMV